MGAEMVQELYAGSAESQEPAEAQLAGGGVVQEASQWGGEETLLIGRHVGALLEWSRAARRGAVSSVDHLK